MQGDPASALPRRPRTKTPSTAVPDYPYQRCLLAGERKIGHVKSLRHRVHRLYPSSKLLTFLVVPRSSAFAFRGPAPGSGLRCFPDLRSSRAPPDLHQTVPTPCREGRARGSPARRLPRPAAARSQRRCPMRHRSPAPSCSANQDPRLCFRRMLARLRQSADPRPTREIPWPWAK